LISTAPSNRSASKEVATARRLYCWPPFDRLPRDLNDLGLDRSSRLQLRDDGTIANGSAGADVLELEPIRSDARSLLSIARLNKRSRAEPDISRRTPIDQLASATAGASGQRRAIVPRLANLNGGVHGDSSPRPPLGSRERITIAQRRVSGRKPTSKGRASWPDD
jgi:hypothetical protein